MTEQTNNLWLWADWPAPEHIRAGTSIRSGGYSHAPYDGLNLACHVGDQPDDVIKNRETLSNHLKLPAEPVWLDQTHSSNIISLDTEPESLQADGCHTSRRNKICTIMTADCVPVLLCNTHGTKIAAIHAGWKGICCGILENAIKAFSEPESLLVWIGPCISSEHYEVGKDVYEDCLNHSATLRGAFEQINEDHWCCDLVYMVKIILKNLGVGPIYVCGLCTYKSDKLFYSYRRDGKTGRMASMIWME